jgi:hypothetical protein
LDVARERADNHLGRPAAAESFPGILGRPSCRRHDPYAPGAIAVKDKQQHHCVGFTLPPVFRHLATVAGMHS